MLGLGKRKKKAKEKAKEKSRSLREQFADTSSVDFGSAIEDEDEIISLNEQLEEEASHLMENIKSVIEDPAHSLDVDTDYPDGPALIIAFDDNGESDEEVEKLPGYKKLHEICANTNVDMKIELLEMKDDDDPDDVCLGVAIVLGKPYSESPDANLFGLVGNTENGHVTIQTHKAAKTVAP